MNSWSSAQKIQFLSTYNWRQKLNKYKRKKGKSVVLLNPNITLKITVFYCWKKIKKKKKNWKGRGGEYMVYMYLLVKRQPLYF